MRVYSHVTASFYTYLILMLARTETSRDILGKHYDDQRQKTDRTTPANSKMVRLYSKSSGKFVQVLKKAVNASSLESNKAALLVLESETFGKVRIRQFESNYYICMNIKGEIIGLGQKKGKHLKRCVFRYNTSKDTFSQFISDKYGINENQPRYLAFRQTGEPKLYTRVIDSGQRATKFLIVPVLGNKPKKRNVKRNVSNSKMMQQFPFQNRQEKLNVDKDKRQIYLQYLKCLHKAWQLKRGRHLTRATSRCRLLLRHICKCTKL